MSREEKLERERERRRLKRATDSEYAERERERKRLKRATDSEYAERERKGHRERMRLKSATDADWVERESERKRAQKRLKRATDADWVERERDRDREYKKQNSDKVAAQSAKRRAAKCQATPAWLTKRHHSEMAELYKIAKFLEMTTGRPHHVDHLGALNCEKVLIDGQWVPAFCGLHVPWNLQVVDLPENLSKSNKFIPELALPGVVFCVPAVAISAIPVLIEKHDELELYLNPRPDLPRQPIQQVPEGH